VIGEVAHQEKTWDRRSYSTQPHKIDRYQLDGTIRRKARKEKRKGVPFMIEMRAVPVGLYISMSWV
jgi:hypothetical protein